MYESLKEQLNTFSFQQLKMRNQNRWAGGRINEKKISIHHASWHPSSAIYSVVYHSKSDLVFHSSPWFILIWNKNWENCGYFPWKFLESSSKEPLAILLSANQLNSFLEIDKLHIINKLEEGLPQDSWRTFHPKKHGEISHYQITFRILKLKRANYLLIFWNYLPKI